MLYCLVWELEFATVLYSGLVEESSEVQGKILEKV